MFSRVHRQRCLLFLLFTTIAVTVVALIMYALNQNINLFYMPSDLKQSDINETTTIRVGGMVKEGSLRYINQADKRNIHIRFIIHDLQDAVEVEYHGVLPDLFREGQGVVVQGVWQPPTVKAVQVLAKHDENYMPPEITQGMRKANDA